MIDRESIIQELIRRGVDPNEIAARTQQQISSVSHELATAPPPGRSFGKDIVEGWKKHPLQYGLGTAAGIGAALLTGGPDPSDLATGPAAAHWVTNALISAGASAGGGIAGRGIEQTYQTLSINPQTGYYGLPGAPRSFLDIYEQQAKAALEEGVADLVGNVATKGLSKALKPMTKAIKPGAPVASRRLAGAISRIPKKELSEREIQILGKNLGLTIGQQIDSPLAQIGEDVVTSSLFGSKTMGPFKGVIQPKGLKVIGQDILDELWEEVGERITPSEAGNLFVDSISLREKQATKVINKLYDDLRKTTRGIIDITPLEEASKRFDVASTFTDEMMGQWDEALKGTGIDLTPLKTQIMRMRKMGQVAEKMYETLDDVTRGMEPIDLRQLKIAAKKAFNEAKKSGGAGESAKIMTLSRKIQNIPDFANSFMEAHKIKSNILKESRQLESFYRTKLPDTKRIATNASEYIKKIMREAAENYDTRRGIGPLAQEALERADTFTAKAYSELFSEKNITGLMRIAERHPENVAISLFKPNAVEPIRAAKRVLPDKTFKSLVASKMESMLKPTGEEIVLGQNFLKKFNSLGEDVLEEMFSKEQIANIREAGLIAELVKGPAFGRGGAMLIKITQAGALVSLGTGGFYTDSQRAQKGTAVLLLGPAALGRLMTSKTGIKWLTEGIRTPNWLAQAPVLAVKILKAARGAPEIEPPKMKESKTTQNWNPFKDFPGPPKILPEGGLFGTEEKRQKQNELILKSTR